MAQRQGAAGVTAGDEVRLVMREWQRMTAAGDVEGLLALTAEDVVFLTPGNQPIGKEAFAAGLRQVLAKAEIRSTQEVKEIVTTADLAYAWSRLSVELTPKNGGPKVENHGYALTVFRRSAMGHWQIARDANLMMGAGNPDRV